jgi:PTH2 family peptidyl-tRNA hydrolase
MIAPDDKVTDYVREIIVVRKDLHMPTGKVAAMAAHAAMTFLTSKLIRMEAFKMDTKIFFELGLTPVQALWLTQLEPGSEDQLSFAKIVVAVHSEEELWQVYDNAQRAGLEVHKVVDSGYSHNKPNTFTCIAIGPDYPDRLNPVTGELGLYR